MKFCRDARITVHGVPAGTQAVKTGIALSKKMNERLGLQSRNFVIHNVSRCCQRYSSGQLKEKLAALGQGIRSNVRNENGACGAVLHSASLCGDRSEMSEKPFQHTIDNMAAASLGGH